MLYRLCNLAQGNARTNGWIEDRGARVGVKVEIKELGGLWDVLTVGSTALPKDEMHQQEGRSRKSFTSLKSYR